MTAARAVPLIVALVLSTGVGGASSDQSPGPTPMARVGSHTITAADLERRIGNRLIQQRSELYLMSRQALDELIAEYVMDEEARRLGITREDLEKKIQLETKEVTDRELSIVVDAMKDRYRGVPEPELRANLKQSMWDRRLMAKRREVMESLREKYAINILLEPPRVSVDDGNAPALGPADAPVTVIEFSDFQCPYCAKMAPVLKQLHERFPKDVRIVYRDFPLPGRPQATAAAEAAHCAGEQNRYWEMHDLLFQQQPRLAAPLYFKLAEDLKLDSKKFESCMISGRMQERWRAGAAAGRTYGVTGTPAIFVNGRFFTGALPLDMLVRAVEEELSALGRRASIEIVR